MAKRAARRAKLERFRAELKIEPFGGRVEGLVSLAAARAEFRELHGRRTVGYARLLLTTAAGAREIVNEPVAYADAVRETLTPLRQYASAINSARDAGQTHFVVEIPPEFSFWLVLGLIFLFAGSGLLIAIAGGRSGSKVKS